ncbi:hypothetical protein HGO38_28625 [Rhizobium sp. CG5]|nr:hypothetical protein [Rhizobium sp. CG5]
MRLSWRFSAILPHPVQYNADAPCQSHHRTLCISTFGNLCRDAQLPGENITISEELGLPGDGIDGILEEHRREMTCMKNA